MSDEAELSISELRRKRAQFAGKGAQPGAQPPGAAPETQRMPDPVRPAIEPVIIETTPRMNPAYQSAAAHSFPAQPFPAQPAPQPYAAAEQTKPLPFDPWRIPTALKKRWHWLVIAGFVMCLFGASVGYLRAKYFTRLTFTLRDLGSRTLPSAMEGESYKPRQIAKQTMINFLTSAPLLQRVSSLSTNPPMTLRQMLAALTVTPERDSENVAVTISLKKVADVVNLANLYSKSAVEMSRQQVSRDPIENMSLQSNNLAEIRLNLDDLNRQMTAFLATNDVNANPEFQQAAYAKQFSEDLKMLEDLQIELKQLQRGSTNNAAGPSQEVLDAADRLKKAKEKLRALEDKGLASKHPDVILAGNNVSRLERELADAQKAADHSANTGDDPELKLKKQKLSGQIADYQARVDKSKKEVARYNPLVGYYTEINARMESYRKAQRNSQNRLAEAQQYLNGAEGFYDPPSVITYKDVDTGSRVKTVAMYGILGGFAGVMLSVALILLLEITDSRIKTAADVKRVTELPVLASLGDLAKMDDEARKAWAFRTWTILSGTLSKSANRGTVCGIISCAHGEGRTTWVELLVDAAGQRGFEVTKLDFGKADDRARYAAGDAPESAQTDSAGTNQPPAPGAGPAFASAAPAGKTGVPVPAASQKLMQARAASVIHVQLPGLVWNLERRIQFHEELEKWQSVSSAVILIDLPPASVPEAILLAENLPQVLWLVDSGKSKAVETRMHLETLRHARCKLVGAVLNHEPVSLMKL